MIFATQNATDAVAQKFTVDTYFSASGAVFDQGTRFLHNLGNRFSGSPVGDRSDAERAAPPARSRFSAESEGPRNEVQSAIAGLGLIRSGADDGVESHPWALAYAEDSNPQSASPRYRFWLEGYGSRSHTDAQGAFAGDRRTSYGGIAGFGATLAPGVSVGLSVDRGHTDTQVPGTIVSAGQSSRIDLTQFGGNLTFDSGPWSLAVAGIYGSGNIDSRRTDIGGTPTSSFGTSLWGAIGQVSYYVSRGNWRIVPSAGLDWTLTATDPFVESGGGTPVAGSSQSSKRTRFFGGVNVGYTGQIDRTTTFDIGVYGKMLGTISENVGSLLATPTDGLTPGRRVPGTSNGDFEFATGALLSVRPTSRVRVYTAYDARLRDNSVSHGGTLGVEVRW